MIKLKLDAIIKRDTEGMIDTSLRICEWFLVLPTRSFGWTSPVSERERERVAAANCETCCPERQTQAGCVLGRRQPFKDALADSTPLVPFQAPLLTRLACWPSAARRSPRTRSCSGKWAICLRLKCQEEVMRAFGAPIRPSPSSLCSAAGALSLALFEEAS